MLPPTSAMALVRTSSRVWSASRAVTAADTAPAPCRDRATMSQFRVGAQAARKLPAANTSRPKMITRLRPSRSEAVPNGSCRMAWVSRASIRVRPSTADRIEIAGVSMASP